MTNPDDHYNRSLKASPGGSHVSKQATIPGLDSLSDLVSGTMRHLNTDDGYPHAVALLDSLASKRFLSRSVGSSKGAFKIVYRLSNDRTFKKFLKTSDYPIETLVDDVQSLGDSQFEDLVELLRNETSFEQDTTEAETP